MRDRVAIAMLAAKAVALCEIFWAPPLRFHSRLRWVWSYTEAIEVSSEAFRACHYSPHTDLSEFAPSICSLTNFPMTEDRLPAIPESQWSAAQRACADEIIRGPRGAVIEPFIPLLRSPELCTHAQRMGEYLRYRSAIGLRLSELAILVTARHWAQEVEWAIHAPIAAREGIDAAVIDAIGNNQIPEFAQLDEQMVFEFAKQSLVDKRVSDATWAAVCSNFGEHGAVDLLGIVGYYTMLAVVMNGARTPAPRAASMPLPQLDIPLRP